MFRSNRSTRSGFDRKRIVFAEHGTQGYRRQRLLEGGAAEAGLNLKSYPAVVASISLGCSVRPCSSAKMRAHRTGRYGLGNLVLLPSWKEQHELCINAVDVHRHGTASARSHNNLGLALQAQAEVSAAAAHFQEAIRIRPDYIEAHVNISRVLLLLLPSSRERRD